MKYFLQDSRTYTGNDLMFWAIGGKGYTSDVRQAQFYSEEEAMRQHLARPTDIPWPCHYIYTKTRPAVDMQHVDIAAALEGTGITLQPRQATEQVERLRCEGCGVFMSLGTFWAGACGRCGTDNRP